MFFPCLRDVDKSAGDADSAKADDERTPSDKAETASVLGTAVEDVSKATVDSVKQATLVARDRVSLGGVEVSPLGIGTWAWGDSAFWGYSEAMDKELQEARAKQ